MSPARVLSLAQGALHAPNGLSKALHYLETEACTRHEIGTDARVWACIAYLRRKQGDVTGGDEAEDRARGLVDSQIPPRRLSFEAETRGVERTGAGRGMRRGGQSGDRNLKCRELLQDLGVGIEEKQGRVERLLERTRRLRKISEGLLRSEMSANVEFG